jgi:hypothetical protein
LGTVKAVPGFDLAGIEECGDSAWADHRHCVERKLLAVMLGTTAKIIPEDVLPIAVIAWRPRRRVRLAHEIEQSAHTGHPAAGICLPVILPCAIVGWLISIKPQQSGNETNLG